MKNITTVDSSRRQHLSISGGSYRIIISGEQTNNGYAVIDMLVPPGGGPGPHSHEDIQEMFYVAEGEVEFKTEDGKSIAGQGDFVNIPFGGAVHSFKNTGDKNARLICTVIPAGLERFFQEIGKPIDSEKLPPFSPVTKEEIEKIIIIGEKYGQKFYPPDFLG